MNTCVKCRVNFPSLPAFDAHPCMTTSLDTAAADVLRETRRTSIVTIGPDTVRLCEPECRDEVLLDLGVKGSGGGSAFRSHGETGVHVEWNGKDYRVTWKRCPPSALHCHLCAGQWRYRAAVRKRELTPAQREAFAPYMGLGFAGRTQGRSPAAGAAQEAA
jgi:hypothetical protein